MINRTLDNNNIDLGPLIERYPYSFLEISKDVPSSTDWPELFKLTKYGVFSLKLRTFLARRGIIVTQHTRIMGNSDTTIGVSISVFGKKVISITTSDDISILPNSLQFCFDVLEYILEYGITAETDINSDKLLLEHAKPTDI